MGMMQKVRMTILISAVVCSSIGTTIAQVRMESQSVNPAKSDWTQMKPSSFSVSIAAVRDQCQRSADYSSKDRLEMSHCVVLEAKLSSGECREEFVFDGIIHDLMNGRREGKSKVFERQYKSLGRNDRALVCDVGDSIDVYWYTGDVGVSCNNVAFTFRELPALAVVQEKKFVEVRVCDALPMTTVGPGYTWSVPATLLQSNCGVPFYIGGSQIKYEGLTGQIAFETNCRIIKQEVQQ